jgi:hypothetical protein
MKQCRNCGVSKSLDLFPKQKQNKDGHHSYCKQCRSEYDKSRYDSKERSKLYHENLDKEREARRAYYNKSKNSYYIRKAKRRASLLQRTPSWLTKEHLVNIEKIYIECKKLNESSDSKYEVDHIVPLQGKTVSGLHVPWNLQILLKTENRKKGNR